jgi:peptidoglycan/LPS O-acetylase OafA/YrhL
MQTRDETDHDQRLRALDILRGCAALAVFVFHLQLLAGFNKFRLPTLSLGGHELHNVPNFMSLGSSGVSLFFVLSGLCLALTPLRNVARGQAALETGTYFANRVARVYPAYLFALLFSALVALIWAPRPELAQVAEQFAVHAIFIHGFNGHWLLGLNGPLWSMATEVQFYLAFPLLLQLMLRIGATRFVLAAIGLTCSYRLAASALPIAGREWGSVAVEAVLATQLPGRLAEFALGMGLAQAHVAKRLGSPRRWLVGLALCLPPALAVRALGPKALADTALGAAYACGVAAALTAAARNRPGVANRVATLASAFGRSSYSFFLLHLPTSEVVAGLLALESGRPLANLGKALLWCTPVCVAVSSISYLCIEEPLWRRMRQAPARRATLESVPS